MKKCMLYVLWPLYFSKLGLHLPHPGDRLLLPWAVLKNLVLAKCLVFEKLAELKISQNIKNYRNPSILELFVRPSDDVRF